MGIWQMGWISSDPADVWGNTHGVSWYSLHKRKNFIDDFINTLNKNSKVIKTICIPRFQSVIGPALVFALIFSFDFFQFRDASSFRDQGWDTKASFALGMTQRGSLIVDSALIMALVWLGLIFCSTPFLNQLGFLLFVAFCIDALFIRCFYTALFVVVFGELNWWPLHMPPLHSQGSNDDAAHAEAMRINSQGPLGEAMQEYVRAEQVVYIYFLSQIAILLWKS